MANYSDWQDAWNYLDPDAFGPLDIKRLEQFVSEAEQAFDAELSIRFSTPFDETLNPDAFEIAKNVCGRRGAADYVRWHGQRTGGTDTPRRALELDSDADTWMARLKTPLVPTDAPAADSPQVFVPSDGGGVARTTASFFSRGHVTPGSTTHY